MSGGARRRAVLTAAVMPAGSGLAIALCPTRHLSDEIGFPDLEAIFPISFGDWCVDTSLPVILPAPDVQAQLDKIYIRVLARTYVNAKGDRVMLSVAYGGDQSDASSAHRPEVCYPAQGFAISQNFSSSVRISGREILVCRLMSQMSGRQEPLAYWIVVGDKVVTSGTGQKLAQMRFGLRNVIADGLLVRVSTIDADMARGHRVQSEFLVALGPELDSRFAARVLGECRAAAADGDAC